MIQPSDEASRPPGATPAPRKRAAWGSITRRQVIDAAVREVSEGHYEQMSIRSLARGLGVSPMSLYRHVRNRDDLLDEVTDRLLAAAWRPACDARDWRAWVAEAAQRLRHLLVSQPAALHVYLRHPVATPSALLRMEEILAVLRGVGFDEDAAARAYAALHTYTIGFSALEASRNDWDPTTSAADATMRRLAAFTSPGQFTLGLDYLLAGIERDLAS